MATKLFDVTVNKKRWYRGQGSEESALLCTGPGASKKMCCIGFLARACGLSAKAIRGVSTVGDLEVMARLTKAPLLMGIQHTKEESLLDAYNINDSVDMTDVVRMAKLKTIGKRLGVNFIFVD